MLKVTYIYKTLKFFHRNVQREDEIFIELNGINTFIYHKYVYIIKLINSINLISKAVNVNP